MDDTPRRVKSGADETAKDRVEEMRGRGDETIAAGMDDRARNYAGATTESTPDVNPAGSVGATTAGSSTGHTSGNIPASGDPDNDARTSQIRGEIEQTREEMTETIDAIQEKLRPSSIVANATDRVKQATTERVRSMADRASGTANEMMDYGREAYGTVASEVRQNPIPIAMISIGAAWLLMGQSRSGDRWEGTRHRQRPPYRGVYREQGLWREANRAQYGAPARTDDYGNTAAGSWTGEEEILGNRNGGVMDAITSNPIPAALAAMGIAWLAFSKTTDGGSYTGSGWMSGAGSEDEWRRQFRGAQRSGIGWTGTNTGSGGSDYEGSADDPATRSSGGVASAAQQYASRAQDYAGGIASRARHYADDVTTRAREVADDVGERASEYAERAQEYAGETMQTVQRRGRQAQNELQRMMNDNPLLVGAGALAIGAVVGMALPETERENEWMGEARDTVLDRAQDMARTAASKAQETAGDVVGEIASRVVKGETSH